MNKARILIWAALIILSLLIASGIFYYYQYVKIPELNNQINELNKQIKQLQKKENWKTFTNSGYGYSIKYPSNWYLYNDKLADVRIQPEKDDQETIPGPSSQAVEIKVFSNQPGSLEDFIYQDEHGWNNISHDKKDINIDGENGKIITSTKESLGKDNPVVYIKRKNIIYVMDSNLGDIDNFYDIISTFQFIN